MILVNLEELLKLKVHYGETEYHFDHYAIPVDEIEDALKDGTLKVIDAEPVKHGHWEICVTDFFGGEDVKCSVCGKFGNLPHWHYCPNCGAKMDEVTE